jgi:hypothetical protein
MSNRLISYLLSNLINYLIGYLCNICLLCSLFISVGVATLLWESVRMKFTLPKWGLGTLNPKPLGLPKVQSSITRAKTLRIKEFFISLKSYQSVDVQNGLSWPIWTCATQVMAKRKAESQTGNLTPDHEKL